MNYQEALKKLQQGNQVFCSEKMNSGLGSVTNAKNLVDEQMPFACIISCSDSRVVPEYIFQTDIGELFVIRVAGNIANSSTIASVEYAVEHLDVKLILVLAHQNCGAVTAFHHKKAFSKHIEHLFSHILPNKHNKNANINELSKQNAVSTCHLLWEKSSVLRNSNDIKIIPAYYSLESGEVDIIKT